MGTGSGFFDEELRENGRCPHCLVTVRFQPVEVGERGIVTIDTQIPDLTDNTERSRRSFYFFRCPSCNDVIVWLLTWNGAECNRENHRIYPLRTDHPPAPPGTPPPIRR